MPLAPEYPGPCAVPLLTVALLLRVPKFSMMSTSPQVGQLTVEMFSPSIQKAGQTPLPKGSLMRASIRPYCQLPSVVFVEAPGAPVCRRVRRHRAREPPREARLPRRVVRIGALRLVIEAGGVVDLQSPVGNRADGAVGLD